MGESKRAREGGAEMEGWGSTWVYLSMKSRALGTVMLPRWIKLDPIHCPTCACVRACARARVESSRSWGE